MARTHEEKLRAAKAAAEWVAPPEDADESNSSVYYDHGSASLNTNKPKTVSQVMEFLSRCPIDAEVGAYEGEGGSWICAWWKKNGNGGG